MRALIWIVLLASGLWFGWWYLASQGAQRATESWFADATARGLLAQNDGVTVTGFPNRVDLTVSAPKVADPETGFGWTAPFLQVFAMTWKPWHLIAALPNEQVLTLPDQEITLSSSRFMGSLELHPGPALGLYETVVEVETPKAVSTSGWVLSAGKIAASTREDPSLANAHRLGLRVEALVPDAGLMAALAGRDLPPVIELLRLDATAELTAPVDRAMGQTHPQVQALDLTEARMVWGSFVVTAKGGLKAGPDGRAEGEIAIHIENWRNLPPLLAAMGLISADLAPTLERGLEVLAKSGPDPEVLDLPLKAAKGQMRLGPLPLGAAPVLRRDLAAPAG